MPVATIPPVKLPLYVSPVQVIGVGCSVVPTVLPNVFHNYASTGTPEQHAPASAALYVDTPPADAKEFDYFPVSSGLDPFTHDEDARLEAALRAPRDRPLAEIGGDYLFPLDLQNLRPSSWLITGIVDMYLHLLGETATSVDGLPTVSVFRTDFVRRLMNPLYGYRAVQCSGSPMALASDVVLFPVLLEEHWTLVVLDSRGRKPTLRYFDSCGGFQLNVVAELSLFVVKQKEVREGVIWRPEDVVVINEGGLPRQEGGDDCGVYMCTFAKFYVLGLDPNFHQGDIVYLRRRMALELATKRMRWP